MNQVPAGFGRVVLGFGRKESFDLCVKEYGLQYDASDIESFLQETEIGGEPFYLLRCERRKAPHDPLGDNLFLMLPGSWRSSARFVYCEQENELVEVKHSATCDPAESQKVIASLIAQDMPVFKGRMSYHAAAIDFQKGPGR